MGKIVFERFSSILQSTGLEQVCKDRIANIVKREVFIKIR